ncbi:hypothetical protein [Vibrio parahaemolyticus]|uniref:hypothetical protein n=1 Tax=Vibrio parahaemolyticus TaxID=670 RepID=UPI0023625EFD|nr:hypothetical protein [Vibrio parahaemolyticus]
MFFQEFFIPVAIATTVLYLLIALVLFKRTKETKDNIKEIGSNHEYVKKGVDGMTSKVDNIADEINSTISPLLKSVETEVKKIHCDFNKDIILKRLQENGYTKARFLESGKIFSIIAWNISDDDADPEYIDIHHMITIDTDNSTILIESLSVAIEGEVKAEVYKEILEANYDLKSSDFGITELSDGITAVIAQDYLVFPKNTFHIHPLIEALDDLERAFVSLRSVFQDKKYDFIDVDLEYMASLRATKS